MEQTNDYVKNMLRSMNGYVYNKSNKEKQMKTSESIKNLTKALLTAQTQMGSAKKDSKNPFFKSTYADLPTVMEVVKAPLNEAGIIVLQPASYSDGKNFITTTLLHAETGEYMESQTEVVCSKANDPQAFGAAQTYARRFGLQSMLFIPAEDDDGNYASGRVSKPYEKTTTSDSNPEVKASPTPSVEPMKKSSFRKPKTTETTVATKTIPDTLSEEDWA